MVFFLQAGAVLAGLFALAFFLVPVLVVLAFLMIKQINQYERGVRFTMGKYSGIMQPGWRLLIPVLQSFQRVDMRIVTVDIPKQEVMTKDNVPVRVNAVVYFKVADPAKAVLNIRDYHYAVSQYAQTALRDVVGEKTLDEVLGNRDQIAKEIEVIVDKETDPWGIDVTAIKMQDIELPENMKRTMAKQAEAEREKRAVIIKAEGEKTAAGNIAQAATLLASTPGALHLRTLHTLNDLSSDQSNTVIFAVPLEVLRAFERINDYLQAKERHERRGL